MSFMDNYRTAVRNREEIESKRGTSAMDRVEALEWEADAAAALIAAMTGPCPVCGSTVLSGECVYPRCRQLIDPLDS